MVQQAIASNSAEEPLEVGEIYYRDDSVEQCTADPQKIRQVTQLLEEGNIVIFKRFAVPEELAALKGYLHRIQLSGIPNFFPITATTPNNYRINFDDERAQIRAFFYVWSFFTWNQDVFSLYDRYKPIYSLRNLCCGLEAETFTRRTPDHECSARLSVQLYPAGRGYFSAHTDPVAKHQLVVPIMPMSKYGRDFKTGGNYVVKRNGQKISTEEMVEPGDILLFNARCTHGVDPIDPQVSFDPMSPNGRWMMLFAVNKLASNTSVANAVARNIISAY